VETDVAVLVKVAVPFCAPVFDEGKVKKMAKLNASERTRMTPIVIAIFADLINSSYRLSTFQVSLC